MIEPVQIGDVSLYHGDCLSIMPELPDMCADAIITDIPYGTTACSWDEVIPFEPMWEQIERLDKGAFVTTASQPFTSRLVCSNLVWFKYDWSWDKKVKTGHLNVKKMPLRRHEDVFIYGPSRPKC